MSDKISRWSCRAFKKIDVDDLILRKIVNCGFSSAVGENLYNEFQFTIVNLEAMNHLSKHLKDFFKGEDITYKAEAMIIIGIDENTYKDNKTICDISCGMIASLLERKALKFGLGVCFTNKINNFYKNYKVNSLPKGKVILHDEKYEPILALLLGYPSDLKRKDSYHPIKFKFLDYLKDEDKRLKKNQ